MRLGFERLIVERESHPHRPSSPLFSKFRIRLWYTLAMTMPAEKRRRYSIDEYLRIADDSEVKLEYVDGEIIDMSGGTANHSLLSENFGRELGNRIKGKACRV